MTTLHALKILSFTRIFALIGVLAAAREAYSAGDSPGENTDTCKHWDESAHAWVDHPDAPCWVEGTFGEDAHYDTCFQGNHSYSCVPICGRLLDTKSYKCHKKSCPGYFIYDHDYSDVTYTYIETPCSIDFNTGNIAEDHLECAYTSADCVLIFAQLAESATGACPPPDASQVADCLAGLLDCVTRDPCRWYNGCKAGEPELKGPTYKCTLSNPGCGD